MNHKSILAAVVVIFLGLVWIIFRINQLSDDKRQDSLRKVSDGNSQNNETKVMLLTMRSKMLALQAELDDIRNEQKNASNLAHNPESEASELSREERNVKQIAERFNKIEAINNSMSNSIRSGHRDEIFEDKIRGNFNNPELATTNVEDITCDTQFCRLLLNSSTREDSDGLVNRLVDTGIVEGEGFFLTPEELEDGTFEIVAYLSRSGYHFPRIDINN